VGLRGGRGRRLAAEDGGAVTPPRAPDLLAAVGRRVSARALRNAPFAFAFASSFVLHGAFGVPFAWPRYFSPGGGGVLP
jgi:hypothetical protein